RRHTRFSRDWSSDVCSSDLITNDEFISSMAGASGILCGAGFETPAEALFLNKKLMVVPMKGQFEQQCNAAALKTMGVPVIRKLKDRKERRVGKECRCRW